MFATVFQISIFVLFAIFTSKTAGARGVTAKSRASGTHHSGGGIEGKVRGDAHHDTTGERAVLYVCALKS